ncbi:MerR family transcriptional regulator [Myceligenerans crystallogenes]|uniref:HTH merR-type domain-containing protein n=1 Tax=Myceligenerans crystallogenes TaxID=316335 RepID=A0ABP4ZTE1_9MICO
MTTTALEQFRDLMAGDADGDPRAMLETVVGLFDARFDGESELTIAEVSELVGVSADTLRYYERAGLVSVPRRSSGHRLYDRAAIGRVVFISRLRASDMPIRDIERYVRLVEEGEHTVPDRLGILLAHRERVRQRLADMRWALAIVDFKIDRYDGPAAGRAPASCLPTSTERN